MFYLLPLLAVTYICLIFSRAYDKSKLSFLLKMFCSLIFVLIGALALSSYVCLWGYFLLGGLICGAIGDMFLDLNRIFKKNNEEKGLKSLNLGIYAFGAGHIFYFIVLVMLFGIYSTSFGTALLGGCVAMYYIFILTGGFEKSANLLETYGVLLITVLLYSCFMIIVSRSALAIHFAGCMLLFTASDLFLIKTLFADDSGKTRFEKAFPVAINLLLYFSAQAGIALVPYLVKCFGK